VDTVSPGAGAPRGYRRPAREDVDQVPRWIAEDHVPVSHGPREAGPQVRAAFGRFERASLRVLGIRQFLRLPVVPAGS
jgi:hypothetical protein